MEALKDYFDLTRNEQRGILALCIVMVMLLGLRVALPLIVQAPVDQQLKQHEEMLVAQIEANVKAAGNQPASIKQEYDSDKTAGSINRTFDPNNAGEADLQDLGFKEWQIKNIINFRKSGGIFRKKEDLKKLYSIKSKDYDKFSPLVVISPLQHSSSKPDRTKPQERLVEINSADTSELKSLKGVGGYFARKIVERRERLGGFTSLEQLLEVYHLDPMVLEWNRNRLSIDPLLIRRLSLNKATYDELKSHPYVGYKLASVLFNYRKAHGKFTAIKEISNSVLISDSVYSKIAPYFTVDD